MPAVITGGHLRCRSDRCFSGLLIFKKYFKKVGAKKLTFWRQLCFDIC